VNQARISLNQVLGITQDVEWKPADIKLEEEGEFYFLDKRLDGFLDNEDDLDLFIGLTVKSALYQAPELKAVEKGIEAREEMLKFHQRSRYMPTVAAGFEFNYTLDDTYVGPAANGPFPDDDSWQLGLEVSFPLYSGGGKKYNIKKAMADLEEMKQTHEQVRQLIKFRAYNAVLACSASLPAIELTRIAADRAQKNLNVIKDKYAQGGVSILDLLDAQNQAFVQRQSAAIAVYNYLDDLLEFQRSMAWFETFKTDGEKDEWADEFKRLKERAANY
jgi:outer membrane protein TolC